MKLSPISIDLDDNKNALKCLNCNLTFLSESVLHKHLIKKHIQQPYIQLQRHSTNPPLKLILKSNCGKFEIVKPNSPPVQINSKEEKPIETSEIIENPLVAPKTDNTIENCGSQIIGLPNILEKIPKDESTPSPEGDSITTTISQQPQNAEYPKIKIKTSGLFKEPLVITTPNNTTNKITDNNQLLSKTSSSWSTNIDYPDKNPDPLMYATKDMDNDNTNEFISLETYHEQNKALLATKKSKISTTISENSSNISSTSTAAPVQALTEQVARIIPSSPAVATTKEPKNQQYTQLQQFPRPPMVHPQQIYQSPSQFYSPAMYQQHQYPPTSSNSAKFSPQFRSSPQTSPSEQPRINNNNSVSRQQRPNKFSTMNKAPRGRPPGNSNSGLRIRRSFPSSTSPSSSSLSNSNSQVLIKPKIKRERDRAIIKKRKIDVLTPSDKDDDDCQVVCMQPKNLILGLQIENVQGGFATNNALDSIVKLPESISLSVCKTTNINKEIKKVPEASSVENLATVLAGRKGITVTASNKDQTSSNTSNNNDSTVRGFNLNGSVSIVSKNKVKKSVPINETSSTSTATNAVVVDLTKDSSEISIINKSKKVNEFGIPLIDLKHPRLKQRLHRLGITQFIPLDNFTKNSHGSFALPVFNTASKNVLNNLGITQMLSLGTVKTIP